MTLSFWSQETSFGVTVEVTDVITVTDSVNSLVQSEKK